MGSRNNRVALTQKIDGIVLIGKSWAMLSQPVTVFRLKPPTLVETKMAHCIKSSTVLKDVDRIHCLRMGQINSYEVNLCFYNANARYSFVDYRVLLGIYTKAFKESMECLINRNNTSQTYRSYKENMSRRTVIYSIYPEEFHAFGNHLCRILKDLVSSEEMDEKLNSNGNGDGFDVCVLAEMMGQSLTLNDEYGPNQWNIINKKYLLEAIFHIDFDRSKVDHFVFWSRSELLKRLWILKQEYYAGGIGQHGNFYFEASNEYVKEVKCYSELFKSIHRSSPVPFKDSTLSNFLYGNAMGDLIEFDSYNEKDVDGIEENCNLLSRIVNDITKLKTYYGRMEFIVVITDDDLQSITFPEIMDRVLEFVSEKSLLSDSCFITVNYKDVYKHLKKHLSPAIKHVIDIKNRYEAAKTTGMPFVYNLQDHWNTLASESMLTFFIYGSSVTTNQRKLHCNDLLRDIGITASNMKTAELFPKFKLARSQSKTLEYNPTHYIKKMFPPKLVYAQVVSEMWEVYDQYQRLPCEEHSQLRCDQHFQPVWKNAILFLVGYIIKTANMSIGNRICSDLKTTELLPNVYNSRRVHNCQEFVNWLYGRNHMLHSSRHFIQLQNALSALFAFVPNEIEKNFLKLVAEDLENRMIRENSLLNFVADGQTLKIVIPMKKIMLNVANQEMIAVSNLEILKVCFSCRFNSRTKIVGNLLKGFVQAIYEDEEMRKIIEVLNTPEVLDKYFINYNNFLS